MRQRMKEKEIKRERGERGKKGPNTGWIVREQLSDREKIEGRESLRDGQSRAREIEKEKSKERALS